MTGFGRAEVAIANKTITVEIRTLNSKQLDLSLKMPGAYRSTEPEIRNLMTAGVVRGKCEVYVSSSTNNTESVSAINAPLFGEYYRQISEACAESNIQDKIGDATIAAILRLPDVVTIQREETAPEECEALLACVKEAITHLNSFRYQEGEVLMSDLLRRVALIEGYKDAVIPFEPARLEVIRERMQESIDRYKIEVDKSRFESEMIFYIEKFDITEEKVRLSNHCNYFRQTAQEEEGVGRKLGFIAQEMGREINTMGSKANNADIQKFVVQMKDELEKIKEQVLNIL